MHSFDWSTKIIEWRCFSFLRNWIFLSWVKMLLDLMKVQAHFCTNFTRCMMIAWKNKS